MTDLSIFENECPSNAVCLSWYFLNTSQVFLNGEKLPIKNFQDYIKLYTDKQDVDGEPVKIIYENVNPR